MFRVDPSLGHISATREQVFSLIESINTPYVGVPGYTAQVSEASVVGLRRADDLLAVFVHLHLTETGEAVVYVNDEGDVDADSYQEIEAEALEFVESMGFIMDDLNVQGLSDDQKDELIGRLPCFGAELGTKRTQQAGADMFELDADEDDDSPDDDEEEDIEVQAEGSSAEESAALEIEIQADEGRIAAEQNAPRDRAPSVGQGWRATTEDVESPRIEPRDMEPIQAGRDEPGAVLDAEDLVKGLFAGLDETGLDVISRTQGEQDASRVASSPPAGPTLDPEAVRRIARLLASF